MGDLALFLSALNIGSIISALAAWRKASHASSELSHNHGSSTKDAIARIEKRQDTAEKQISGLGHQIGELNVHLDNYFHAISMVLDK